jgi:hypothetical protein
VKRIVLAGALVAAAALIAPWFAGAEVVKFPDANDTRGPLDVKKVRVAGEDVLRYKVITFSRWSTSDMRDRGFVLVSFDTFSTSRFDYYALVRSIGDQLDAQLFRDRKTKSDYVVASLKKWRASRKSVSVSVPIRKMNWPQSRDFYRWRVQTLFTSGSCKRVCFDVAPDSGAVKVFRRGASPTPTPSPTVTPSPTPTTP